MCDTKDQVIERKVGERVDVLCNFEPDSVKDLGNGAFSATVTTSDVDRMGESIDSQGIDTTAFMQNPVVLYGHDYQGLPIGKATKISSFKNKVTAQFQLAIAEYPFAATVAAMIKGGYLNAVSIGGVVKQWNDDWTQIQQMEMVEFSVVPVPANPNALITAGFEQTTGKSIEVVSKEFHDFVQQSTVEKMEKSLDIDELDRHIKSLEDLTVILKTAKAAKIDTKENSEDDEKIILTLRKAGGHISETGQKIIRLTPRKKS